MHSRQKAWRTIPTVAPSAATVQRGALRAIRAGPSSALPVSQQSQRKRRGRMPVLRRALPVTQQAVSRQLCSPCQHQLSRRCPTLCQRPTRQQRKRVRTTLPWRWRRPSPTQQRSSTSLSTPDGVRHILHPADERHCAHGFRPLTLHEVTHVHVLVHACHRRAVRRQCGPEHEVVIWALSLQEDRLRTQVHIASTISRP